jgi:hypothetical protein
VGRLGQRRGGAYGYNFDERCAAVGHSRAAKAASQHSKITRPKSVDIYLEACVLYSMTLAGPILVHAIDKSRQQIFHSGIQNSKEDSIIV